MSESDMAVFEYRVKALERSEGKLHERVNGHDRDLNLVRTNQTEMHEQISGEGGLYSQIRGLRKEVGSIRTALYALTGSIIVATVAMATLIANHA